jgi:hypothetical protein
MFTPVLVAAALQTGALQPLAQAEIGGRITVDGSAALPRPIEVRLYSDQACLTSVQPDPRGTYLLRVPPGPYWLSVEVAGHEVEAVRVEVGPRSTVRNVVLKESVLPESVRASLERPAARTRWTAVDSPMPVINGNEERHSARWPGQAWTSR